MNIRAFRAHDLPALRQLLTSTEEFLLLESEVAMELAEECITRPEDTSYRALSALGADGTLLGWACYGRTPMTRATYDLYWIVTAAHARGQGVGRKLHDAVIDAVRESGGERVRAETSSREGYGATMAFYDRLGYTRAGLIPGFYAPDDDLVTYVLTIEADGPSN